MGDTAPQPSIDIPDLARALGRELFAFAALGEAEVIRLDEFAIGQPGGGGINVPVAPNNTIQIPQTFQGTSIYTSVLAVLPAGGGVLALGPRIIPLPAGVTTLGPVAFAVAAESARILTVTNGGQAWLELFGYGLVGTGAGVIRTGR